VPFGATSSGPLRVRSFWSRHLRRRVVVAAGIDMSKNRMRTSADWHRGASRGENLWDQRIRRASTPLARTDGDFLHPKSDEDVSVEEAGGCRQTTLRYYRCRLAEFSTGNPIKWRTPSDSQHRSDNPSSSCGTSDVPHDGNAACQSFAQIVSKAAHYGRLRNRERPPRSSGSFACDRRWILSPWWWPSYRMLLGAVAALLLDCFS